MADMTRLGERWPNFPRERSGNMSYLLEMLGRGLAATMHEALADCFAREGGSNGAAPADSEGLRRLLTHEYAAAREAFLAALERNPEDHFARIGLACSLDGLSLTRAALEQFHDALRARPEDAAALFGIAFCHEKLQEAEIAIEFYERALACRPQLSHARERLAAIHLRLENTSAAIEHYEQVCWSDPGNIDRSMALGNLYMRAERFEQAIERFQYAITIEPDNWGTQEDLITAYVQAGRPDDAVGALRRMIELRPECADQYVRLGKLLKDLGRKTQALAAFEHALVLQPDFLEALIQCGSMHLQHGTFEEAAVCFCRAIEANDRVVSAYAGLAAAQQALGRNDDARENLRTAASIAPNTTTLFAEVARLQMKSAAGQQIHKHLSPPGVGGDDRSNDPGVACMMDRQIGILRDAIDRRPGHADLHYRLGLLLRHAGDLRGAVEAYERAVAINPQYHKALIKLSLTLYESGSVERAMDVAMRALMVDSQSIDLHYDLGLMFADQERFAAALDRFAKSSGRPHGPDAVAHVRLALQNMGLLDRADETIRELQSIHAVTAASTNPESAVRIPRTDRA